MRGALLVVMLAACTRDVDVGADKAAEIVAALYSDAAGAPVDVMQVRESGAFYKVTVAPHGTRDYVDAYLTRDGARITEHLASVDEERRKISDERRFTECLLAHRVSLLGVAGTPQTEMQLKLIGRFSQRLLVRCDVDEENCRKLGAATFPSTIVDGKVHEGLRSREWLETATGCK